MSFITKSQILISNIGQRKLLTNTTTTIIRTFSSKNDLYRQLIFEKAFIDGKFCQSENGEKFNVLNPSNGKLIGNVADCTVNDVKRAVQAAKRSFNDHWSQTLAKDRAQLLKRLFTLQLDNTEPLAQLITAEMGKPIRESRGEIMYGASFLEWFAEEARRIHGEILQSPWPDKRISYRKEPSGTVAIITPWNFPNAMVTRKMAAALAAGCTVVIKPPEDTPFSVLALAALSIKAGFPPGVINIVPVSRKNTQKIGSYLCNASDISVISFTGSTQVGKWLLQNSANTVKRVCLELGGDAPFIVFDSADIDKAVQGCIVSKFRNAGQTCVCANRIFVQDAIHDRFVDSLAKQMQKELIVGDGFDENTTIGPLINGKAMEKVMTHVEDAQSKGAKILIGGHKHEQQGGYFFQPTLITNAKSDMLIAQEETFGPIAAIFRFKTENDVIRMANDCRRGLAGYFYSQDYAQIERITRRLEVGMIGINDGILSCCEAPFGGIKESGLGREGGTHFGVDEFLNVKYVCHGGMF
ncbi:succinic semialdehyde dehydrogenase [Dermatophagoides pteronyssinus]|uniref:succinic semialdehyde dehydrogenase n=1 Tax=Dermatophagoides pteronyssinus TaxID=6956 RepID=UPI003F66BB5A